MRGRLTRRPWVRRAVTLPLLALAAMGATALAPLVLPLAVARDTLGRRRWGLTRGLLVLCLLLAMETFGVIRAGWIWLRWGGPWIDARGARDAFIRDNHALQRWWASTLWDRSRRLLGVRVETSGLEALHGDGPLLVLVRHASHADTLLPVVLLGTRRLRYVLKAELLLDPCLDVVGQRLRNAFVTRGGVDRAAEVTRVAQLAEGLAADEAVVVFPEGTRATPAKRARVIQRLEARGDLEGAALARQLARTLPPLREGAVALVERSADADVVVVAHRGLEVANRLPNLLSGALVGATVKVHVWRVPAAEVPRDPAGAQAFLAAQWRSVDLLAGGVQPEAGRPGAKALPARVGARRRQRVGDVALG